MLEPAYTTFEINLVWLFIFMSIPLFIGFLIGFCVCAVLTMNRVCDELAEEARKEKPHER